MSAPGDDAIERAFEAMKSPPEPEPRAIRADNAEQAAARPETMRFETIEDALVARALACREFFRLYVAGELYPKEANGVALCKLAEQIAAVTGDDEQVARLLAGSALNRRADAHGSGTTRYTAKQLATCVEMARAALANGSAPAAEPEPLRIDTLAALSADPALLTVPKPLSRWLVWNGELTVLVGREKFGKSTLVTDDAIAALSGGHRVLWVTAEEGRNLIVTRFAARGCKSADVLVPNRWPRSWTEVEAIIADTKPGAVYVDSLSSFLMAVEGRVPETSEGERWHALVLRFKGWTRIGAGGVCVLLHATKADGSYRGSTGIGAAPDTIVTMRAVPSDEHGRFLETVGRWGFPSKTVRYAGEREGYVDASDAPERRPDVRSLTRQEQKVYDALTGAVTSLEWERAAGVPHATFRRAREYLVHEREWVEYDDDTGRYARPAF